MMLMAPCLATAQVKMMSKSTTLPHKSAAERQATLKEMKARYPLVGKLGYMEQKTPKFVQPIRRSMRMSYSAAGNSLKSPVAAKDFWANLIYYSGITDEERSYYSMNVSDGSAYRLGLSGIEFNGGAALVNGILYGVNFDTSTFQYGYVTSKIYKINTETWTLIQTWGEDYSYLDNPAMIALETATDNTTGTVYGAFYNKDLNGYELGIADYPNQSRSTIGTLTHTYVALGYSTDGFLYGIASDGNLYKIDTASAAESLVGATGLTLTDNQDVASFQGGEIDQASNTFYWTAVDGNHNSGLYTVNLSTGAATKISDFSNGEQYVGVIIQPSPADSEAPDIVSNLKIDFPNGATEGTLSFTMPTKTYGGGTLSGQLGYTVCVNGDTLLTGESQAGEQISKSLEMTTGSKTFVITTSNAAGSSPKVKQTVYVGTDKVKVPSDLTLTISDQGLVDFSWTESATGEQDGYVGNITYNVYRITDAGEVQVATGLTETHFTEQLEMTPKALYQYAVEAVADAGQSERATTEKVAFGGAYDTPFKETFDNEDRLKLWTIIDVGNDGTWRWYYRQTASYSYNYEGDADDWLITPPIHLKADREYIFSLDAASAYADTPETFHVAMGTAPTVEAMTTEIIPMTTIDVEEKQNFSNVAVRVSQEGDYYFGIHAKGREDMRLDIDNVTVSDGALMTAPAAVESLTVTADENLENKATVSFTAPSKLVNGEAISSSLSKVEIYRDGTLAGTLNDVAAGSNQSFTDENAAKGYNTYYVVPWLTNDSISIGRRSQTVKVYVGLDEPIASTPKALDNLSSVTLSWNQVSSKGKHGGIVKPEDVEYKVWDTTTDNWGLSLTDLLTTTKDLQYSFDYNTTEGETQKIHYWGLETDNDAGSSIVPVVGLIIGQPLTLPLDDYFTNGESEHQWFFTSEKWANLVIGDHSSDNDGSCLGVNSINDDNIATVISSKIDLTTAANPALIFDASSDAEGNTIEVGVYERGAADTVWLGKKNLTSEFERQVIDLSNYANKEYTQYFFRVYFSTASMAYIDNIHVQDLYSVDMESSVSTKQHTIQGKSVDVKVKLLNRGENIAKGYTVKLEGDDQTITCHYDTPLSLMQDTTVSIPFTPSVFKEGRSVTLKATVEIDGDENDSNNSSECSLLVKDSNVPAPTDVKAEDKSTSVSISWTAPEREATTVTEDFENQPIFLEDEVDDWTFVNANGNLTEGITFYENYKKIPNEGTDYAFQVVDFNELWGMTSQPGHSGWASLLSPLRQDRNYNEADCDNWAITPELSGNAQTVSFWAINTDDGYPEDIQVLYSTTDTCLKSFISLDDSVRITGNQWQQLSYSLPEGARYFAVRQITRAGVGERLNLDDFTFEQTSGSVDHYNIYVDGELVATAKSTETSIAYGEALSEGSHTYAVSAVYVSGKESAPTVATYVTVINEVTGETSQPFDIYSIDGTLVKKAATSFSGLRQGIYIVNGNKVVVR
jgi:hypothetical protein